MSDDIESQGSLCYQGKVMRAVMEGFVTSLFKTTGEICLTYRQHNVGLILMSKLCLFTGYITLFN